MPCPSVCESVQMSCKQYSSFTDEPVLLKRYSCSIQNMCIKEDKPGPKLIKGDNSREILV